MIKEGQSTKCSTDFIQNFFEEPYKKLAPLLIFMFRHGTIHQYQPKFILLANGKTIGFMVDHPEIMGCKGETYYHLQYKITFFPFLLKLHMRTY